MNKTSIISNRHEFFSFTDPVNTLVKPLAEKTGITSFTFKRTYHNFSKIYLTNNPHHLDYYFSGKYYAVGSKEAPFSDYTSCHDLWDYLPNHNGVYSNLEKRLNITHGLTITRKHENYCDFFVFGTGRENIAIKNFYMNHMNMFDIFCDVFLDIGKPIISAAFSERVILPYKPVNKKKILLISDLLTKRENDCVKHLIQGKSNKAIAKSLGISSRTVEEHLDHIRSKLNAKNRSTLISILNQHQYR